jgi:hypothetical protein
MSMVPFLAKSKGQEFLKLDLILRVLDYFVSISFGNILCCGCFNLYCGGFILFCNVRVCVCVCVWVSGEGI